MPSVRAATAPIELRKSRNSSIRAFLCILKDSVSKGQGSFGVLAVALLSPFAFSVLPWSLGVLIVFLVGIVIEAGPGVALDYLTHLEETESRGGSFDVCSALGGAPGSQRPPSHHDQALDSAVILQRGVTSPTTRRGREHEFQSSLLEARVEVREFRVVERKFASYKISVSCRVPVRIGSSSDAAGTESACAWSVWKRYSDFEDLRERLDNPCDKHGYEGQLLPPIPPKTLFKNLSPRFLARRAQSLEEFLVRIITRADICDEPVLRMFLGLAPLPGRSQSLSLSQECVEKKRERGSGVGEEEGREGQEEEGRGQVDRDADERRSEDDGDTDSHEDEGTDGYESREDPALSAPHCSSSLVSVAAAGLSLPTFCRPKNEADEKHHVEQDTPRARGSSVDDPKRRGNRGSSLSMDGNEVSTEEEDGAEAALPDVRAETGDGSKLSARSAPEERCENDESQGSGYRQTFSSASTDDGMDDEEREARSAKHVLETVRALSGHSPSQWDRVGPSSGLPFLGPTDRNRSSDDPSAAPAAASPPPSRHQSVRAPGASVQDFASWRLRLQHPNAYYDPGRGNSFRVRGRRYLHDRLKTPAGPPVGELVIAYVFRISPENPGQREDHIASRGRMAEILREMQDMKGRDGKPTFFFLLNFQVPGDPPLSMVTVFALPRDRRPAEDGCFWTLFDHFVDFPMDDGEGESKSDRGGRYPLSDFKNKRFKLIPSIVDGPSMIKWAVGNKPTILGQKLTQRYFRGEDYVEVDVDIASSALASQIVSLCRGYAKYLQVEMGILLQGEDETAELPEKLLGTIGIRNLDINSFGVERYSNVRPEEADGIN